MHQVVGNLKTLGDEIHGLVDC